MIKSLTLLLGLFAPVTLLALGLGNLQVNSGLNQRLDATIALHGVKSGDLESLVVRIADENVFAEAGLSRPMLLNTLKLEVEPIGETGGQIRVTSNTNIREPAWDLIIEVAWTNGRSLREYSIVLSTQ